MNRLTNCQAEEFAVGEIDGVVSFAAGQSSFMGKIDSQGLHRFRSVRLDTFCREAIPPTLIKIDVEGAELAVLTGGASTLRKHRPNILLATHSAELHEACRDFLNALDYRVSELANDELIALPFTATTAPHA